MDNSVFGLGWAAWIAETNERLGALALAEPSEPYEPYKPPEPPATFTLREMPSQVLATVLDPHSSPDGVRLAMGTAAFIKREAMLHKSKVALLGLREMADMAGIHKDTVARAEARQQTVVRISNGTPLVIEDGHGDPSVWTLVTMDNPQPVTVPLDPHNGRFLDAGAITDFFNPAHQRWSTRQGGMTSRSYWLVLALLLTRGLTKVTVTTVEAAALVGANRSTASRSLADIVTHLDGFAHRTASGLEIDMGLMLSMDWGRPYNPAKEAARRAERAKWKDTPTALATRDAKRYLANLRAGPIVQPELVAWVEAHFDEMIATFRMAIEFDKPEPTPEPTPKPEPNDIDPGELQGRDRVPNPFQR